MSPVGGANPAYFKPGAREDANQIREYPVRFTDLDLFDHMNAVYWSVIEDYLSTTRAAHSAAEGDHRT